MFEKEKYNSENSSKNLGQEPQVRDTSKQEKLESEGSVASGFLAGKFKSVEDLSKAYVELEKKFGQQAFELGDFDAVDRMEALLQGKETEDEQL